MTQDQSNSQLSSQQPLVAQQQPIVSGPITQDSGVGKPANSQNPTSGSANPLDQLEELIKNAQTRAGAGAGQVVPGQPITSEASPQDPISSEQLQQNDELKLERIKQLKAQKEEEEKELVTKQQEMIKQNTIESDQIQKRAEAKAEEAQDSGSVSDGLMIRQLDYIKIKKPAE